MRIELKQAAKRFRHEWILRHLNLTFAVGSSYAITGPNGSGKSTLLKMLSGHLTPSKGSIYFQDLAGEAIEVSEIYRHLSYAAPYIDLIEEFSLLEALRFHLHFQPFPPDLHQDTFLELLDLPSSAHHKPLRYFSSGMKQRFKLALALCAETPILLLDEPTTNLDRSGAQWYRSVVERFTGRRLLIIASNVEEDLDFCTERIDILDFK